MSDGRVPVRPVSRMLLNVDTVARMLDISTSTVYMLIRDGRLPSVAIDGTAKRLVPHSKLDEWLRALVAEQCGETK